MSRKRPLSDENIIATLDEFADSEDGLDSDDDSIDDPDFIPDLEEFEHEAPDIDIDVDSIIQSLESIDEGPSTSTETVPSAEIASEPSYDKKLRKDNKEKLAKLNLRWKQKNLELNEEQLTFMGNKTLGPDLLELDTPEQFFSTYFQMNLSLKLLKRLTYIKCRKVPIALHG